MLRRGRYFLRAHDLRGTFVTLALAVGQTEAWVTDRTGHLARSQMIPLQARLEDGHGEAAGLGWLAAARRGHPGARPRCKRGCK